jgi:hypothetical protein
LDNNESSGDDDISRLIHTAFVLLHTLDAVISNNYPMLASGWLPPFPGRLLSPAGLLQRISTVGYSIVSFLSGLILALYP